MVLTSSVSADTDDLDAFADHGGGLQRSLWTIHETLARQRNYLLSAGLPQIVVSSEVATLDNTLLFMADLDRFVVDISSALKRVGTDLGAGMHWAPTERLQAQLDRTDVWRLDRLEQALQTEGFDPDVARRLREQVDGLVADDPRFELGGATLSEPADLAAAIAANLGDRLQGLLDASRTTSSTLHARPRLSIERLAAELSFGADGDVLVPSELLDQELRSALTTDQYEQLQTQLAILDQRQLLANRSLIGDAPSGVELDTDIDRLAAEAAVLYQDNQVGLTYGGGYRLNEPEIAYRLQKLAEDDPGRSLAVKWLLDGMLTPHERSELDRVLATNGSFGERVGVATAHPGDGLVGAAKGFWNDNAGWLLDGWADAEVAITNGFHTMATNQGFGRPAELDRALPRSPRTWAENDDIVELEFTLDNLAEQGGADLAVAIELASAAYGGGRGGVGLVRVGRRYFLRNGDDLVVSLGPRLTGQLDEGVRYRPLGRGSTVNPDMNRFHPRSLRERLAIDEVMQRPEIGSPASQGMGDSRWRSIDGWEKRQRTVDPGGGEGPVTVHYNYNPITDEVDDFKIVGRRPFVPAPEPETPRGGG